MNVNKAIKQLLAGLLALTAALTLLPIIPAHAAETQYYSDSSERVGRVVQVNNSGHEVGSFNEERMTVESETAYCTDINTGFIPGYKTRSDAAAHMSTEQISDVALSLEYVKQSKATYRLTDKQAYLLEQCVLWRVFSDYLGWNSNNVRADYGDVSKAVQDEVYVGAKKFASDNRHRYRCFGYIYQGSGQDIGQFFSELNVGKATLKKTSANPTITNANNCYSIKGATYGVYSDKDCNTSPSQISHL